MSGGSLNYIETKDANWFFSSRGLETLGEAVGMMESYGHPEAAKALDALGRKIHRMINDIDMEIGDWDEPFREMLKSLDRRGSCDDTPEQLEEAVEAWKASIR